MPVTAIVTYTQWGVKRVFACRYRDVTISPAINVDHNKPTCRDTPRGVLVVATDSELAIDAVMPGDRVNIVLVKNNVLELNGIRG